jgi:hypothetical protein
VQWTPEGGGEGGSLALDVSVDGGGRKSVAFPWRGPSTRGTLAARFETPGGSGGTEARIGDPPPDPGWAWSGSGLVEGKAEVEFLLPRGFEDGALTLDLHAGRTPREALAAFLRLPAAERDAGVLSRAGGVLASAAALPLARGTDDPTKDLIQRTIARTLDLLRDLRASSPGGSEPAGEEDAYAVAAAAEALAYAFAEERLAAKLPGAERAALGPRILEILRGRRDLDDAARAYLCLGLSLAGEREAAREAVTRRYPKLLRVSLPPATLARLALVLMAAGDAEAAAVAAELRECIPLREGKAHFLRLAPGDIPESDPVVAAGLSLRALAPFPAGDPLLDALFRLLLERRRGTAWGLPYRSGQAAAGLAAVADSPEGPAGVSARLNSVFEAEWEREPGLGWARFPAGAAAPGRNLLDLDAGPGGFAFWSLEGRAPGRREVSGEVRVEFHFAALESAGGSWRPSPDPGALLLGFPVEGTAVIASERTFEDVLVSLPLPSGIVPLEGSRIPGGRPLPPGASMGFDRGGVLFHLPRLPAAQVVVLRFVALAGWRGTFVLPPALVVRLGDGAIGYSREGKIEIR